MSKQKKKTTGSKSAKTPQRATKGPAAPRRPAGKNKKASPKRVSTKTAKTASKSKSAQKGVAPKVAAKQPPAKSAPQKPKPAPPKTATTKPQPAAKAPSTTPAPTAAKTTTKTETKPTPAAIAAVAATPPPPKPYTRPKPRPKGKILPRQFLFDLAAAIKEAVLPVIAEGRGREIVGTAISGDATFELDKIAEKALLNYLKNARAQVAYYSEDSGYSTFTNTQPKNLLLVDPVDGTRAAKSGFEGCVVSIASTRVIERPTLGDIDNACIMELFGDRIFYAERGEGTKIYQGGQIKKPKPTKQTNIESLSWSMTVPGRPAELIFPTAARLIDLSSLKGGFFACNSTAYSLTRLITGQLDAAVDIANRYMREIPMQVRDYFVNAGRGAVLGIAPYDIAAALLLAQEAGCVVTDAFGKGFDDVLVLDSSESNHMSMIAASNPELHGKLMSFFDTRIKQFETLLKRHNQAG